jgi:hypothetical protein
VNVVLEEILIYLHFLAHIPKGIMKNIKKFCFKFLWSGKEGQEEIHQTSWKIILIPNDEGGWGLKNIHVFGAMLAGNSV